MIPAAGRATRLGEPAGSKEVLSVPAADQPVAHPALVIDTLLEALRRAGAADAYVVIRDDKWDIPRSLGDGSARGIPLAYLMMGLPYGAPYSLDQAFPFVQGRPVLLGFPDILFRPVDAFVRLTDRLEAGGAEIVLGLFPAADPRTMDMVAFDAEGRVSRVYVKPAQTELRYTWILAAWAPEFTEYLHRFLQADQARASLPGASELHVGDVIQAAIGDGLRAVAEVFPAGSALDVGTPGNLQRARQGHWPGPGGTR